MKSSLKNKLLFSTLIIIVLGMGSFAVIAYTRAKQAFDSMIIEEINQVADTTVTSMTAWLEDRRIDIHDWSQQRLFRTTLHPTFLGSTARTYASRQLKKTKTDYGYYENIVVAAPSGKTMAIADPFIDQSINILEQPWFINPETAATHVTGRVTKSQATGNFVFTIAAPIMEEDKPVGLLYGILRADTLIKRFLEPIKIGEHGYAYVFREDGEIITGTDTYKILGTTNIFNHPFGSSLAEQGEGITEYELNAQDMTAVVRQFDPIGLTIVVCARTDEILAPVRELRDLYLTIVVIVVVFVSIALVFIANSLNRPIQVLVAGLDKMGRGDLSHRINVQTSDELASIGHAMNDMARKLEASHDKINIQNKMLTQARDELEQKVEERTRELKLAEQKYRSIFENAVEGIFRLDDEGKFVHANPSMARILGFTHPNEVAGMVEAFFADTDILDALKYQLQRNEEIIGFETRILRQDKPDCWCSISARVIKDSNGTRIGYEGSVIDISERIEKEKAEKEKEAAITANQVKSKFLANMSHEIRTPLNAIIGFCGLLSDMLSDPKQRNYIQAITTAGNALLSLINDILDMSKMEAGKMPIIPTKVSIPGLMDEIRLLFETEILEKGISFEMNIKDEFPFCLYLDETRLRQILVNLVGNAVKFTDQGHIRIVVEQTQNLERDNYCDLKISVEDTGIGIRDSQLGKVFQSFEQVDSSIKKKYGGTGLGLPICKRLAKAMGGNISVSSIPGKGSCFTVVLKKIPLDSPDTWEKTAKTPAQITAQAHMPLAPDSIPSALKTKIKEDIFPQSQSFHDAVVVKDVAEWAARLNSLSREYSVDPLIAFSGEVALSADAFDIRMIQKQMNEFSILVSLIVQMD